MKTNLDTILGMRHSPLENYIVPGLTSWMIANLKEKGLIRLFEQTRHQEMAIAPHSHRFDFECIVLRGSVENTIWQPGIHEHDLFRATDLIYSGIPGVYTREPRKEPEKWTPSRTFYREGDRYQMLHEQVHSIKFARGSLVMFFEGPQVTNKSLLLDPYVNGITVPQSATESWMFRKDSSTAPDDHFA